MKYPRIAHLSYSTVTDPDDIVSEADINGMPWIVTEKIDGSQTGLEMVNGRIEAWNRNTALLGGGMDRQYHPLPGWIATRQVALEALLGDRIILFGEWMFHVHTLVYNRLPDWFIGFDLYNKKGNAFLPFHESMAMMQQAGLSTVPILFDGIVHGRKDVEGFIKQSAFGDCMMEGVVLHSPDGMLHYKYVTLAFKQQMDAVKQHWWKGERRKNVLLMA